LAEPSFTAEAVTRDGATELHLRGALTLADGDALWESLHQQLGDSANVRVDLSEVRQIDGAGAALLIALARECEAAGGTVELAGANDQVQRVLALYTPAHSETAPEHTETRVGFIEQVGHAVWQQLRDFKAVLTFTGQLTVGLVSALRKPRTVHWRDLGHLIERAGADAVPIVALINFLVGLIMGYQSAIQLRRFGANLFIADLVGLSITRELAPLMTAIIVAGRSGAAYAAELGTMQVREEIDALSTLSIDPARFLVFPRILALAIAVPLLTLLGDLLGCVGGLVVGVMQLDLTMTMYLTELREAVDMWDVAGGVVKSAVFAATITLISCQRGLATRGGADAVGLSTTSAVVISLFALVTLDAGFAVLFNALGI
jgi:phospholipid/cholesterol/gamma-HCH transport system permease protein